MRRAPEILPSAEVVAVPSPLATIKESADYLKCSEAYLNKRRTRGLAPSWLRTLYGIRYRISSLDAFLAETSKPGGRMESKRRKRREKPSAGQDTAGAAP